MDNFQEQLKLQPIMNIGMLGSVSDVKSTTVLQLTGTKTQKHSSEMKRNITINAIAPGFISTDMTEQNNGINIEELIKETADLWLHSLLLLRYKGLGPEDVLNELASRFGRSGIEEKKDRKK